MVFTFLVCELTALLLQPLSHTDLFSIHFLLKYEREKFFNKKNTKKKNLTKLWRQMLMVS